MISELNEINSNEIEDVPIINITNEHESTEELERITMEGANSSLRVNSHDTINFTN